MAIITTLSSDFELDSFYGAEELMGAKDIGDWFKTSVKAMVSPITSIAKGIGHTVMETGRGLSRGDVGRVLLAPVKGIGHTTGSFYRDEKEHLSYYWRPSRMSWMKPMGAAVGAIGAIPGPHSIIMVPLGIAMATAGTIGDASFKKKKAEEAYKEGQINAEEQAQLKQENTKKTLMWIGLIGAGGLIASQVL